MKKILSGVIFLMLVVLPLQAFAQQLGACCYNNNTQCASPVSEASCLSGPPDGIWHANVTCQDDPCNTGVPTMNEWGMIIFAMLSGLGIIYFLRKQRRAEN